MKKKLLSLNLVIVMLLMMAQPVFADNICLGKNANVSISDNIKSMYNVNHSTYSNNTSMIDLNEKRFDDGQYMLLSTNKVYSINVESVTFKSNSNAKGDNWNYTAEDSTLHLDNYNGGTISAGGDLIVEAKNGVIINGNANNYGIYAEGDLLLSIINSSVNITGGSGIGNYEGKPAVSAKHSIYIQNFSNSDSYFYGGNSVSAVAGDAIKGGISENDEIVLFEDYGVNGRLYIKGGYSSNNNNGAGIYGGSIYISCDSSINGNSNYMYTTVGIYYENELIFGTNDIVVNTGNGNDKDWWAIAGKPETYAYSNHTKIDTSTNSINSGNGYEDVVYRVVISVNKYTLILDGDGGKCEGKSTIVIEDKYPYTINLSDYIFKVDEGYIQVNWVNASSSDLIPLADMYQPEEDTILKASWLQADKGNTVVNSVIGKFEDGKEYKKYTDSTITLPKSVKNDSKGILTGWRDSIYFKYEDGSESGESCNHICKGNWYAPGSEYKADLNKINEIYSDFVFEESDFAAVRYHPGIGQIKSNGNIIMQQINEFKDGQESLNIKVPTAEKYIVTPSGYEFAGWSDKENSSSIKYKNMDNIEISNKTITDLYAVWKYVGYTSSPENGITVTYKPNEQNVTVLMTAEWCKKNNTSNAICALYRNGKQIASAVQKYSSGSDMKLTMNYIGTDDIQCSIFTIDTNWKPTRTEVTFDMSDIK